MKVKILGKTKNTVRFEIEDASAAFANAIRRTIMNSVPVMAVDKIRVNKNTSALYNEVLAHRIGLVPLTFESDAYVLPAECSCKGKGCAKCQVLLGLKKAGPATVYTADFQSTDSKVAPTDGNIPIVKLLAGQEIDIEAVARLGTGNEHARWEPAIVGYNYEKDASRIVMNVESISGLSAPEIVVAAAKVLAAQLEKFKKQI